MQSAGCECDVFTRMCGVKEVHFQPLDFALDVLFDEIRAVFEMMRYEIMRALKFLSVLVR